MRLRNRNSRVLLAPHDLPQSSRDGDGPTPYDASEPQWV